jgi:glycerol-3-phosphate dehydrogenase
VLLVGTTDVDHGRRVENDPVISQGEVDYLLDGLERCFPGLELDEHDVQATFAGVRAVVDTGNPNPSKESREFVLWNEDGLLTVTGGKLTTFRLMAHSALRSVRSRLSGNPRFSARDRVLNALPFDDRDYSVLEPSTRLRLFGRYGSDARALISTAQPGELAPIGSTTSLWAELRWAAHAEGVIHLDDLLLRRVRLGLQARRGGLDLLERVRAIVQQELCWDNARWEREAAAYNELWQAAYSLPAH